MATVVCANCGIENDASNKICQSCGKPLKAAASSSDKTVMASRTKAAPPPMPEPAAPPPPMPASAPAVPPPPPAYKPTVPLSGTPIHSLGIRSDGWSDVIEGAAEQEEAVQKSFAEELKAVEIPGLVIGDSMLSNGLTTRKYQVVYNGNGANVLVRIAPYGKNLLAGWDLYTKRSINWLTIGLLGGIVLLFALVYHLIGFWGAFFGGLFGFLEQFVSLLFVPTLLVMLFGKIVKDDWLGLFVKDLDEFAADDAVALTSAVDSALSKAIDSAKAEKPKEKK